VTSFVGQCSRQINTSYTLYYFHRGKRPKFDILCLIHVLRGLMFFRGTRAITPEFVRVCTLCPFSFLCSFSVYPPLCSPRSALWLPWRHSKPETNYSSPAAALLLYVEHPPKTVATLLLLFIALSCIMFASGDQ
jgi:hypothetical protein